MLVVQAFFPLWAPGSILRRKPRIKILLVGTDANNVIFLPRVHFGSDLHREMKLLSDAGLTSAEILAGATGLAAKAFGVDSIEILEPGCYADMVLIDGAPDRNIADTSRIRKVWIGGVEVFSA